MEFSAREEGNTVQCSYCQFDVMPVGTGWSSARGRKEMRVSVATCRCEVVLSVDTRDVWTRCLLTLLDYGH